MAKSPYDVSRAQFIAEYRALYAVAKDAINAMGQVKATRRWGFWQYRDEAKRIADIATPEAEAVRQAVAKLAACLGRGRTEILVDINPNTEVIAAYEHV